MSFDDPINGKHYSAGQKIEAGITGYEQDYEASNKMRQYDLAQQMKLNDAAPPVYFNPLGKKVYAWEKYVVIGFILCIPIFGWNLISKNQYSSKYVGENQVTEGLVTRSPYVQNIELSNPLVKLGLNKDGSIKSKAEIIQDYKNVLTGVIPNATLNSLISSINNDPNFNLLSTDKLRMMALKNHTGELFDENYAKFYLNKLYYDPSKPNEKYYFVFTNLQSTQCDENNVCVKGFVYHNNYYLAR